MSEGKAVVVVLDRTRESLEQLGLMFTAEALSETLNTAVKCQGQPGATPLPEHAA